MTIDDEWCPGGRAGTAQGGEEEEEEEEDPFLCKFPLFVRLASLSSSKSLFS